MKTAHLWLGLLTILPARERGWAGYNYVQPQ